MKLVLSGDNTFDWVHNGKSMATITLYDDGLVEFIQNGGKVVVVENVGTENVCMFSKNMRCIDET